MGRASRSVELLQTLIEWAGGEAEFHTSTGIRVQDQRHYMKGNKRITLPRLRRATEQLFGVPPSFVSFAERAPLPAQLPAILNGKPGIYAFFSSAGSLVYFGKATTLRAEINQTLGRSTPSILFQGRQRGARHFAMSLPSIPPMAFFGETPSSDTIWKPWSCMRF
jgi:hypothetical protein